MKEKGIVYILTNDCMPNLVKIGITQKENVQDRMRELDKTGLPIPFTCHFAIRVEDYESVEKLAHDVFKDQRVRKNREFFKVEPERVVSALKLTGGEPISGLEGISIDEEGSKVDETKISKVAKEMIEAKERREKFSFEKLNIPVGSELVYTRDREKQCTVADADSGKVMYNDELFSVSKLAKKLLNESGANYSNVNGFMYFEYDGKILTELREEMEENNDSEI